MVQPAQCVAAQPRSPQSSGSPLYERQMTTDAAIQSAPHFPRKKARPTADKGAGLKTFGGLAEGNAALK